MTQRRHPRAARPAPRTSARFFATAAKGTERLLAEELQELGLPHVTAEPGGVRFGERTEDAYRACLWSRIALRIVEALHSFECHNGDDLYDGVRRVDWSAVFGGAQTLAVRAAGSGPALTHTHFIALRTKDAIVDQLRDEHGRRPNVSRDDPDVLVFVHVTRARATVHLDYSGASLHARGLRDAGAQAPLRETLAAALVRFSGWRGDTPLLDPMCGSGTLLFEAAGWAGQRAPGLDRERFGFERWSSFDQGARARFAELKAEARARARPIPELFGSDTDGRALEQTSQQAARAGLQIQLRRASFTEVEARPGPGAVLMNPPYGQRLQRPAELERDLDRLLERFAQHQRALIVPADFPVRHGTSRWLAVYNGALECEFRRFDAAPAARGPE